MTEQALEERVCVDLAVQGFLTLKVGAVGWPDRLILLGNGRHIWFEFKVPGGALRRTQLLRIRMLRDKGESVYVVTSELEAKRAVAESL